VTVIIFYDIISTSGFKT